MSNLGTARAAAAPGVAEARVGDNWVSLLDSMDPVATPESLMVRYQEGDLTAAGALVRLLSPPLYRFFLAQFASRRFAEDLLQETWMRIHQVRHTYRPGEPVLPWLYAIARHIRVDHFRKVQRLAAREERLEESAEIPQATPPNPGRAPDLGELLATLPEGQREVIALLKVSGMSLEEVARATSSTVGAVKQKAHRAYERLRQLLPGMGTPRMGKGATS